MYRDLALSLLHGLDEYGVPTQYLVLHLKSVEPRYRIRYLYLPVLELSLHHSSVPTEVGKVSA